MNCPSCGSQNADTSKFCLKCGAALASTSLPGTPVSAPIPQSHSVAVPATIGGLAGLVGGVLIVIGWLTPWFGLGGFGITGNGLQFMILALSGGLSSTQYGNSGSGLGAVLGILVALLLALIPLAGILCFRKGIRLFEIRSATDDQAKTTVKRHLKQLRSLAAASFVPMFLVFLLVSLIPFGGQTLANGYFLTIGGMALTFLGALFVQSSI